VKFRVVMSDETSFFMEEADLWHARKAIARSWDEYERSCVSIQTLRWVPPWDPDKDGEWASHSKIIANPDHIRYIEEML
jgi:hypothetical protein